MITVITWSDSETGEASAYEFDAGDFLLHDDGSVSLVDGDEVVAYLPAHSFLAVSRSENILDGGA